MSITEIISKINGTSWCVIILVLLSLIEITPIKINPWSHLLKWFGGTMNKDVTNQLKEIKKEVTDMDKRIEKLDARLDESNIIQARSRILRFGDEVSHGVNHSRDHFKQIFRDITVYKQYCEDHPDFNNDMTRITSQRIEDDFLDRDKNDTFL